MEIIHITDILPDGEWYRNTKIIHITDILPDIEWYRNKSVQNHHKRRPVHDPNPHCVIVINTYPG